MFQVVVKELRESAGYSQTNFAKALGVSQSTVGMWESGRNKPTYSMLVKIANTLGVSLGYLLDESNDVLAGAAQGSSKAEIKRIAMPDSSLSPEIHSGDVLLCSPCNKFINGKIMAFKRDGSIIVRKISFENDMYLALGPSPSALPIIITNDMLEKGEIQVVGHVIEMRRKCR
ncbi:MAG: helix-turn-helix domain-containing protein [Ruminococcaceae bacterium]|nr:helix-turn-helix domain-containing protein [Oscillospiraceae bacterium]